MVLICTWEQRVLKNDFLDFVIKVSKRLVSITVWGVHPQVNWDRRDAFVGACYPVGLCLNFCPHFIKIHELLSFAVQEFSIFYTQWQGNVYKGDGETEDKGNKKERESERENIKWMKAANRRQCA